MGLDDILTSRSLVLLHIVDESYDSSQHEFAEGGRWVSLVTDDITAVYLHCGWRC